MEQSQSGVAVENRNRIIMILKTKKKATTKEQKRIELREYEA